MASDLQQEQQAHATAAAACGNGMDDVYARAYDDLRRLARQRLRRGGPLTLIDATSLVHEVYLRCRGGEQGRFVDTSHFMAHAARVMRSIIIDEIRRRRTLRRGGPMMLVTLNDEMIESLAKSDDDVERISEALDELALVDERATRVVEMRFFAGFSEREIGEALGVDERTVRRDWKKARMLLAVKLG
jgi:RNA polymerase sigma factor (TIGR02999 family)